MLRSLALLLLLLSACGSHASVAVLRNAQLVASIDSVHGLLNITSAAAGGAAHSFAPGSDGWALDVSALNSTANAFTLTGGGGSGGCALKSFRPTGADATFSYNCPTAGYCVEVAYELQAEWSFLKKHLRGCKCGTDSVCLPSWEGTIRAVTHWTGLALGPGYTGRAAENPIAGPSTFHPKADEALGATATGVPPGELQPAYIAGFFRKDSDGLFCSVMNPFGVYLPRNSSGTVDHGAAAARADINWGTAMAHACSSNNKIKFFSNVTSFAACQALCAAEPACVEFEWKNHHDPKAKTHWCALYNTTETPIPNLGYDCGCRGVCPTRPGPTPHPHPPPPPGPRPPGPAPPSDVLPPVVHARFEPIFLQTKRHTTWYEAEAAVLGLTALQQYEVDSFSGVNLGERQAFTAAVEFSLRDGGASRRPVRVQVGWDSNDYQIDVGTAAGRTEYKRMLDRDASLGVTHAIYAPQNSLRSAINASSDMWGWEEALWIELGQAIREQKWLPGRDSVPPEIEEMIQYGLSKGVKLMAYAYPVLPFQGSGSEPTDKDGWLYIEKDNRGNNAKNNKNCTICEHRASLADPRFQIYLAKLLSGFVNATGIGGFAWDYTGFKDWRQPTEYAEWRGWTRILALLRADHPEIVMDHRQSSHIWGPWNHAAGSYTEPIAGDENPESYGAAGAGGVPTLSTDGVLANNLRRVNLVYRGRQLEPNVRIPGFMFHQSERHFDNRCNANGHFDSQGIWQGCAHPGECACQGPNTDNFSHANVRDFDFLGYRFGLLSSIGTAGLNNVLAMLPARDQAEFESFPQTEVDWIQKWLNFTDTNYKALHETIPIAALDRGQVEGAGEPRVGFLDGTASMLPDDTEGFLFLYNPGPRPVQATLTVDEGMGISNTSSDATWLVHEIYPREEEDGRQTPIGLWQHGQAVDVSVSGHCQVLRLRRVDPTTLTLPIVFNLSYVNATETHVPTGMPTKKKSNLEVTGAVGLSGDSTTAVALTKLRPQFPVVNGISVMAGKGSGCTDSPAAQSLGECTPLLLRFSGFAGLREVAEATQTSPPADYTGGWFNTSIRTDSSMGHQLQAMQHAYPVPWSPQDMDATWLGNRLLLFPYILEPSINFTKPRMWLDGQELELQEAYNSRGNHQTKCFLGWFLGSKQPSAWPHPLPKAGTGKLSIWLPPLPNGSALNGLFWHGLRNEWSSAVLGEAPAGNLTICAANDPAEMPPAPSAGAKSVLYLLVDDLRPQLSIYGKAEMHTPNIERLAKAGMTFEHAYCQIAVCSPSRMSFLSGRRPGTSGIYNFKNHIRQAQCPTAATQTAIRMSSSFIKNITIEQNLGAAGECCTQCTNDPACHAFTYHGGTNSLKAKGPSASVCSLFSAALSTLQTTPAPMGVISGGSGEFISAKWTAHPEHFKNNGYLTLSTGKVWHTEEGGLSMSSPGAGENGGMGWGMPPNQDPVCWSDGCSMALVNSVANMFACPDCTSNGSVSENCKRGGSQGCPLAAADHNGIISDPDQAPLCDKTIGDDAVAKLQLASEFKQRTGRPWFLAAGFRKPHMPWRFPKSFLQYYGVPADIELAKHQTMGPNVPPIAHHTPDLQSKSGGDPYQPMPNLTAQWSRLSYYGAVSWVDSQIGRVINKLAEVKATPDTLIIFHSDHGWNLGEHGQWQKFTNWETGVRVPLVISAPWLAQSVGKRSSSVVELVDIYPTTIALTGLTPPRGETLDGTSLAPLLKDPIGASAKWTKPALSQYPRCPATPQGQWTTNSSLMWQNNWCEMTDRLDIPWMGYSLRTADFRFTEWAKWDGSKQLPDWNVLAGRELYAHHADDGGATCFDEFENVNLATVPAHAEDVRRLSAQLHALVAAQPHTGPL